MKLFNFMWWNMEVKINLYYSLEHIHYYYQGSEIVKACNLQLCMIIYFNTSLLMSITSPHFKLLSDSNSLNDHSEPINTFRFETSLFTNIFGFPHPLTYYRFQFFHVKQSSSNKWEGSPLKWIIKPFTKTRISFHRQYNYSNSII